MSDSRVGWDQECDVLVVGSGSGLAGALAAKDRGLDVLVIEKAKWVGGATSMSGGTLWLFDSPFLKAAGLEDSVTKGRAHLDAVIGPPTRASTPERRDAYIEGGKQLIDLFARHDIPLAHSGWPDYYAEREGGIPEGRTHHALPLDTRTLGADREALRPTPIVVVANSVEVAVLALGPRTWKAAKIWARVGFRALKAKLTGAKLVTRGQALIGRVFGAARKAGVPVWRDTALLDLIAAEDGRVEGALVRREGREMRIKARRGVMLTAGGFAKDAAMREAHQAPVGTAWSMAPADDTGDAIKLGEKLGAAIDLMDEAWWVPGTTPPGSVMLHVWDRCFPHAIIVDANGERFVNEADPYMEVGQIMLARQRALGRHSWIVLESRHRNRYAFGMSPPRLTPKAWFESGYMKKADTLDGLAAQCGLDAKAFKAGVARFNAMAKAGVDDDFRRGSSVYNRFYGDGRVKPNPNLGAIERGPFYAVAIYPGDVGTAGGLVTDAHGRVLREDGSAIPGLYAAGNTTASAFGRTYPGAGASIGAGMIFAVRAARHMAGDNA